MDRSFLGILLVILGGVDLLVCMIRSVILYFLLIIAIRLMGKRQIGELEPSEFVIAMLLADLAAVPMQNLGIPLLTGIIPILTVLAIEILLSVLSYYSIPIRKLICGTPIILMENGEILHENMKKTRVTTDELMEQLREKGLLDLATIKYAILETNGQISAFTFDQNAPVTRADMCIQTNNEETLPLTLVSNGSLLFKNLQQSCYNEQTLREELSKLGLQYSDIFLLTTDNSGKLYVAKKEHPQ